MKTLLSFANIILLICNVTADNRAKKCERIGQESNYLFTENDVPPKITSTKDYLEFTNKKIEKVSVPTNNERKLSVDNDGNVYFQRGEKLFISGGIDKGDPTEVTGITLFANRTNEILIDRIYNYVFVGTHNGLFVLKSGGTRAVQLSLTKNIAIDFGVVDTYGNIYFGTDGSNTVRNEQLYVLQRPTNSLIRIKGIETTLGSYPIESRDNRNKIAIDSKNNVYLGAYSSYVYFIKSGDTVATKIKDNRDNGGVTAIAIDSKDNVYCRTYTELNVYGNGTFVKILETTDYFDLFISVDENDDVHFNIDGEENVLKTKEIEAFEVNGMLSDMSIILNKNLMVRNNHFYFTTRGNGSETICAIKTGDTKIIEIYYATEYHSIAVDKQSNIYFTAASTKIANKIVPYVLRSNAMMPIEIRGVTSRLIYSAYTDNKDNVYFSASNGLHRLNYDEVIPRRLRATASNVSSVVVAKNDNIYFGTYYDGAFVLQVGEIEATKISGISEEYEQHGPSPVETFADKNYDIVYFQTHNGSLYKLMSGEAAVSRVVETADIQFYLSDCENNTYYVNDNDIYLLESGQSIAQQIAQVYGQILSIEIDSSNRIYFATAIGLQVLNAGETTTTLLTDTIFVNALAIDKDDNVYFGTNNGAFVFLAGNSIVQPIHGFNEDVVRIVVSGYDIYFITNMGRGLFMLQNKLDLGPLFPNRTLGEIDNNDEETILNTLNFLNIGNDYLLNPSKNKVINKTETSAIVVGVRGKYFGQFKVEYTILNRIENDFKYFVDVDFLKKAVFFNYINENLFNHKKTNDIKDIDLNIENLRFSTVQVLKDSDLNSSVEFRNVCDMKKVANSSPVNQIIKFSECNYNGKETISFQIISGINKPAWAYDPSKPLITADDENIVSDYLYNTPGDNDERNAPITLSNEFELANANNFSKESDLYTFSEPEQDIVVPPKQQVSLKYSVRTFINKISLKLIQKIHGVIVSKVSDNEDEQIVQITLRNAMQVLQKYSQLPTEVTINDDNSITFTGKGILTSHRESMPMANNNIVFNSKLKRTQRSSGCRYVIPLDKG